MVLPQATTAAPPPVPAMSPGRHNASWQDGVATNSDPVLDISHEHRHAHLHHSAAALKGREHETVAYSTGTSPDKSVVPEDQTHEAHVQQRWRSTSKEVDVDSAEKGGVFDSIESASSEEKGRGRFASFYARWRIFFHLFIFTFFTA